MKANEFVRKHGLNSFKAAMACPQFARHKYTIIYSDEIDFSNELIEKHADYMFNASEIKRLVESHELVEYMGGIGKAKEQAYVLAMEVDGFNPAKIEKAIADVESCTEAGKRLEVNDGY